MAGEHHTFRPVRAELAQLVILPGDPLTPCPELLTEEEAVRYFRLDTINIKNPAATLRRYRSQGLIKGTQIGKKVFYRRVELDSFLAERTEKNPR